MYVYVFKISIVETPFQYTYKSPTYVSLLLKGTFLPTEGVDINYFKKSLC